MSIIPSFLDLRGSELSDPFSPNKWMETPDGMVFRAEVPGLRKEEMKVEIENGNILNITGQRNMTMEQTSDTSRVVEMSSGTFTRRLQLPENAKMDQIKASMEHGFLTITVPKAQATIQASSY